MLSGPPLPSPPSFPGGLQVRLGAVASPMDYVRGRTRRCATAQGRPSILLQGSVPGLYDAGKILLDIGSLALKLSV